MGRYKETHGKTRVGNFLRSLGDVGKPILKAAAGLTGQEWMSTIADNIKTSKELSEEQRQIALELHLTDAKDRANARQMNSEIQNSENASWLAKNTGYLIDIAMITLLFIVVCSLFFVTVPKQNENIAYMVFGMVLGYVGSIITFHRGSSEGSKSKTMELLKSVRKK